MRIFENGVYRDATPEEIAEREREEAAKLVTEPSPEERMEQIEAALIELAAMLGGA